jgi:hypothetical protein
MQDLVENANEADDRDFATVIGVVTRFSVRQAFSDSYRLRSMNLGRS